jgi:hypothetical protein
MKLPHTILVASAILCAAVLSAHASQAVDVDLVEKALRATFDPSDESWAFTETAIENGQMRVSRFDPRLPEDEQWHLISVDGQAPTEKERKSAAQKRKAEREAANPDSPFPNWTGDSSIDPESLSLVEDTPAYVIYRFIPQTKDEDDAKSSQYIHITLRIIKDGPYVASVDMRSPKPFKPGVGVKIEEFVTTLSFQPVSANGTILPSAVGFRLLGRAFFVKKINVQTNVSYRDYELVGDGASASPTDDKPR